MADNRIAFGLCKQHNIKLPEGATPHDAWEALKEHGIVAGDDSGKSGTIVPGRGEPHKDRSKYRKFTDKKSVDEFFLYDDEERGLLAKRRSTHAQWEKHLTPHQRFVLNDYTADGYSNINSFLREYDNGNKYNIDYIKGEISALDAAISSYTLKEPIVTYRSINSSAFSDFLEDISSLEGTVYYDKAFMSTSPSLDSPALNKDLLMSIYLPAGKGIGAYISEYNGLNEIEFLLARGSRFIITKACKNHNTYHIEMELIR